MSDLKHLSKLEEEYFRFIFNAFNGRNTERSEDVIHSLLLSVTLDVFINTNPKMTNQCLTMIQRITEFTSHLTSNINKEEIFYFAGNLYDIHTDIVSLDQMLETINEAS